MSAAVASSTWAAISLPFSIASSAASRADGPPDRQRARAAGAAAGHEGGVALAHADDLEGDAELLGDELRIGGLVALAVRLGADDDGDRAVGLDPDMAGVEGPPPQVST